MWTANIQFKSDRNVIVEDLQSINKESSYDSSISKTTNFSQFHLVHGQRLTFIGKSTILTSISDEIEYVELNNHN